MIYVNGWVKDYVNALFKSRGYDPEKEEVFETIENQWENWKRLMVQSGLNADKGVAEDVAYEFSTKRVMGGASRIFEHFADYVLSKPKKVREFEAAKYTVRENVQCDICEGRGVVMIPVTCTAKDGIERTEKRGYKCECEASIPYSSITMASPDMLDLACKEVRLRDQELSAWSAANGLDESDPAEYRRQWARMFSAKPLFANSAKDRPRTGRDKPAEESTTREREVVKAGIPDEREMALAAYDDGDERGWDF